MTRGTKRFLIRTLKWVFVPLALVVVGYLFVGPYVSDWMNESRAGNQDESPSSQR